MTRSGIVVTTQLLTLTERIALSYSFYIETFPAARLRGMGSVEAVG